MAFKKARSFNIPREKAIIDESTEEILDYLLRSRNFLSELTLLKLNHKVKISFTKKISRIIQRFTKTSKINNSKNYLVLCLTVSFIAGGCSLASSNKAYAISNELRQQIISIDRNGHTLIPLNSAGFIGSDRRHSSVVPVSEELKDNLSGIKPGQPLMLIPQNSAVYTVKKGESLLQISNKYNVPLKKLISANSKVNLVTLTGGEKLIIPNNKVVSQRDHRYKLASRGFSPSIGFTQDRYFRWPIEGEKSVSSKFGFRGFRNHKGIDICKTYGSPIIASKPGKVVLSGWNGEYGQCIIIDHGYGIQTLYAHASKLLVRVGQSVNAGQTIAKIGQTGRATAPHVHFEVIQNGTSRNPEKYLKS